MKLQLQRNHLSGLETYYTAIPSARVAPEWLGDAGWFIKLQAAEHLWHKEPKNEKEDTSEVQAGLGKCMGDTPENVFFRKAHLMHLHSLLIPTNLKESPREATVIC